MPRLAEAPQRLETTINKRYGQNTIRVDYPHVGLFDVGEHQIWIAKRRLFGPSPSQTSHARLLVGGSQTSSVAEKDRFLCYWYVNAGTSFEIQGTQLPEDQSHLIVRIDPSWNHLSRQLISPIQERAWEHNYNRQVRWAQYIRDSYFEFGLKISLHLLTERPEESQLFFETSR